MAIQVSQDALRPKADISASALKLLQFEADIRRCSKRDELIFHLANQLSRLIPYDLAFVFEQDGKKRRHVLLSNNVAEIEKSSPLIYKLNQWASLDVSLNAAKPYSINDVLGEEHDLPYECTYWQPIVAESGHGDSGLFVLLFSNFAYSEQQQALLSRLAETYEHAFRAIEAKPNKARLSRGKSRFLKLSFAAVLVAACAIPLPMSVMAPVQVIAKDPYIVTAPFNGVIKSINIDPNTYVDQGQTLLNFEDIQMRNEYLIELQRLAVAKANFEKTQGESFTSGEGKYQLNAVRAELSLALVETRYRREQLDRTQMKASRSGLVIYADKEALEGKAVQVGERILQVAQPGQIQYQIDLPSAQSMAFESGAKISIYLDSAPLGGHEAQLESVSYLPTVTQEGVASFTVLASPTVGKTPKIGARGTARIYAEHAPLIWHVLRRPVNTVRQWMGI